MSDEISVKNPKKKRGGGGAKNPASLANLRPPWQEGEVQNPGGRPISKPISQAIKKLGEMTRDELSNYVPKTAWEEMAKARIEHGYEKIKGSVQSFESVADRVEGKVVSNVQIGGGVVVLNITPEEDEF